MKTIIIILITSILTSSCLNKDRRNNSTTTKNMDETNAPLLSTNKKGLSHAKAVIKTVHGNITFRFFPKKAPNTSTRISSLIKTGFYDGLIFHRVIPNFVIQTGDPLGNGQGGSGTHLQAEFNNIAHARGIVAMARKQNDEDSADSQFYIALKSLPHLDGKYTIFGQVTEGLSVLDKVQRGDKIISLTLVHDAL